VGKAPAIWLFAETTYEASPCALLDTPRSRPVLVTPPMWPMAGDRDEAPIRPMIACPNAPQGDFYTSPPAGV
jgi:hypothetical protein